jgi:tetratricopeptide (TPR) repeat protein
MQSLDLPPGMMHDLGGAMDELRRAERFYRAALGVDPGLVAAAVRHGRVLHLLRAHGEARRLLERTRPRIPDRPTQYFASLFLGDALAALGDAAAADRSYARAAALFPRAQTPALLRSALARAAGDRNRAAALIRETLSHPVDPTELVDPWRTYATAQAADAPERLTTLRATLSGGAPR